MDFSADAVCDQSASYYVGSEKTEPRNIEFSGFEFDVNKAGINEFQDAEEFYENLHEPGRTLSAEISDDDHSNQEDLEEKVMFKRWFNEPVKDGPYIAK